MLDADRRALTIAVDELNSISGMIRPDDRIDLFIISRENRDVPGGKENKVVMPLMQDVLVKATGNIVRRETAADGREYDRRYSTLTLDLLPEEIGKVLIAQENGELKAALKRPEQQATHYQPTRETDLWPGEDGTRGGVAFYIGGKSGGGVLKSELQPYSNETVVGGMRPAETAQAQLPGDVGKIGGPMTKEQIEQIEQHIKRQREEKAVANGAADTTNVNVVSAERRTQ
jgi:Flp pilus assembly protein CpaB